MLSRSTNRTDRSIYKPKTVIEGSTFVRHSISILLKSKWIENSQIPGCDSLMMQIVDIGKQDVRYHTQNGNWSCKPTTHVATATWIGKPVEKDAKSFDSLWALKCGWQLKHINETLDVPSFKLKLGFAFGRFRPSHLCLILPSSRSAVQASLKVPNLPA